MCVCVRGVQVELSADRETLRRKNFVERVQQQVEYYLSDDYLERDETIRAAVASNRLGTSLVHPYTVVVKADGADVCVAVGFVPITDLLPLAALQKILGRTTAPSMMLETVAKGARTHTS